MSYAGLISIIGSIVIVMIDASQGAIYFAMCAIFNAALFTRGIRREIVDREVTQ